MQFKEGIPILKACNLAIIIAHVEIVDFLM